MRGNDADGVAIDVGPIVLPQRDDGSFAESEVAHGAEETLEFAVAVVGREVGAHLDGGERAGGIRPDEVAFGIASGPIMETGRLGAEAAIDGVFEEVARVRRAGRGGGGGEGGVGGVDFLGGEGAGLGGVGEDFEALDEIGLFEPVEPFQDGRSGADAQGGGEAAGGDGGTDVGQQEGGESFEGLGVADGVAHGHVAVDHVQDELSEDVGFAGGEEGRESAEGEVIANAFGRGMRVGEAEEFGVGKRSEFAVEVAAREVGAEFGAQHGGVGAGHEDAESLVELLLDVALPTGDELDFVEHEIGGFLGGDDAVQHGEIGGREGGEAEIVEEEGQRRRRIAFGPLVEQGALSAAADAGGDEGESFDGAQGFEGVPRHGFSPGHLVALGGDDRAQFRFQHDPRSFLGGAR